MGATVPVDTATNEEDGKLPAVNVGGNGSGTTDAADMSRVVQEAVAAVEAASGEAGEIDLLNVLARRPVCKVGEKHSVIRVAL